jgi:outer membrane immunogenic protein
LHAIRICAASAVLLALTLTAQALELPGKARNAHAQAPLPAHQWTGLYGGLNFGYGIAGISDSAPLAVNTAMYGVLGGGQLGYNYQSGNVVVGIEADIQASNQSNSATWTIPVVGSITVGHKIPYFGTVRGRLGFAFTCGCVMAYATLGVAYGAYEPYATALGTTVSQTYTKDALVAGVGVEWMVSEKWSLKLEGLYLDTGNVGALTLPVVGTIHAELRDAIMRLGVNYHF